MTQQIIDTGLVANDGTGESLRNAFTAVNNNFANVWAAGPVDTQVVISSNVVSTNVTNLDLRLAGNGIGTITVESTVVPSIDRVYDLGTPTKQYDSVYAQYYFGNGAFLTGISGGNGSASNSFSTISANGVNIVATSATDTLTLASGNNVVILGNSGTDTVSISLVNNPVFSGNITAGSNIIGSNIIGSNVNTVNLSLSGNVLSGLTVTGNVTAPYFQGNGSQLTGVVTSLGGNLAANINTGIYNLYSSNGAVKIDDTLSVTGTVITTGGILSGGPFTTTANVTANYFIGDGSQLTNLPAGNYSNANVAAYLPTYTGNVSAGNVTTTGNISGSYVLGNGSQLTGISTSLSGNLAGNIDTLEYSINSSNGEVRFGNSISVIGNAIITDNLLVGDQIATTGNITTTANVIADYFVGNFIGNISGNLVVPGSNTQVIFNTSGDADATSGLTFNKVSNVLAVGGNVSAAGNVSGAYILGNGSQLTGLPALYGNANVADYLAVYTGNISAGNVSATGNISAGNVLANVLYGNTSSVVGNITTSGNVIASYFVGNFAGNISGNLTVPGANTQVIFNTNGSADATSGLTFDKASNVLAVSGNVSATGNISGNYILGNGSQLTGIDATSIQNGSSNVRVAANGNVSISIAGTSNIIVVSATGEHVTGVVSATGNVTGGNLLTGGLISATANVIAGNVNTSNIQPASGSLTLGTSSGNLNLQPAGNLVLANTVINSVAYPLQDTDAASKIYVDNMVSTGLAYHAPVTAATTTTLAIATGGTITYTQPNGVSNGVGAYLSTTGSFNLIDTANIQTVGTRVLVQNEANAVYNGVYTWANASVIVRSSDTDSYGADATDHLSLNDYFFVSSGNVNKGSAFVVSAPPGTITFGTSNISFAQFSSSQTYTANTDAGISLSGTQFNAKVDQNTTAFDGTGNIIVKAGANLTTPNIGAATGASLSVTGNVTGDYILGNGVQLTGILGNNTNMGSNTVGALISNAVTLTTTTTVTNGIALLNQVLGKLVPPSPPNFPNSTTITLSGIATYRMANITQVDNTPGANRAVAAGTSVANVLRVATYATNTISNVGPGDAGTIVAVRNGANVGNVTLNTGASPSANGTYGGNLVITNNFDYNSANANIAAGFWYVFSTRVSGTAAPGGWNELYIADSSTGNTNTTVWYYDNSSPSTPSFSSTSMTPPGSANLLYSSTIPHYTNNNNFNIGFTVANISGNTYPTSNTLASGSSGGAFAAPVTVNYSGSNIGSNVLNSFASATANTTASVTTGFGGSATGPSMSVNNSYSTGTLTLTTALGNTVLWKSGTSTAIDESNVVINTTIGTGSGNAYRIVNPGTGNTPAYSGSEAAFNSQSSTLQAYDATVVGSGSSGVLKHDQTNYSTGYLPTGPNLSSGRTGTQYFTFKFVRTAVSKFDVKYSGNIAGMWVALPGSVIDSSSSANGWINMAVAYGGAGYPGVNSPGNGSDGCAVGGIVSLNTSVTNSSKTCTFGTVSSSSTATNEIYVRIALTSGQSVTALTLETASN